MIEWHLSGEQIEEMNKYARTGKKMKAQRCDTSSWDGGPPEEGWLDENVHSVQEKAEEKNGEEEQKDGGGCGAGGFRDAGYDMLYFYPRFFFLFATSHTRVYYYYILGKAALAHMEAATQRRSQ